jgi:3D (Asp-Asp-Asp) domain-containing protein
MEKLTHRTVRRASHVWLPLSLVGLLTVISIACAPRKEAPPPPPPAPPPQAAAPTPALRPFTATAYTVEGKTASGGHTHDGVVAADPKVLPIGSRIRVSDAGRYSGVYTVTDTGRAIHGQEIDIYIANNAEAKKFGKKTVQVEVLQDGKGAGDGKPQPRVSDADAADATQ